MTNPTLHFILRDSASPTTTVNLYNIARETAGSSNIFNNTEFILDNGDRAIDYGTDKRVWNFRISTQAQMTTSFTNSNETDLNTLYALRTTQTIQLVDNWKASAEVITVHFVEFQKSPHPQTGTWIYSLKLLEV